MQEQGRLRKEADWLTSMGRVIFNYLITKILFSWIFSGKYCLIEYNKNTSTLPTWKRPSIVNFLKSILSSIFSKLSLNIQPNHYPLTINHWKSASLAFSHYRNSRYVSKSSAILRIFFHYVFLRHPWGNSARLLQLRVDPTCV